MIIHYNNGKPEKEKLIRDVICVQVIGNDYPVTVCVKSGRELQISLDNIECILDDDICRKKTDEEKTIKPCPFCGKAAHLSMLKGGNFNRYMVVCSSRYCIASEATCFGKRYPTEKDAIEAWNRRTDK